MKLLKLSLTTLVLTLSLSLKVAQLRASTLGDVLQGFNGELNVTFGQSLKVAHGLDVQNGTTDTLLVAPFAKYGPFSLDTGGVLPQDSKKIGTALIGGSFSLSYFISHGFPGLTENLKAVTPNSMNNFFDALYIGFAPVYNFNVQPNEIALKLEFYSGLEFKF